MPHVVVDLVRISRLRDAGRPQPTSADAKQAAALHAELPQDLFHLGVSQAVDAFTFTVALPLVAFCVVPAPWLPPTKAPTEEAKTPALIG
jgi:hypothetical protein